MVSKRKYRAIPVKNVDLKWCLENLAPGAVTVGMDVSKEEIFAVLRHEGGDFLRPWKVRQPAELLYFVELLRQLGASRSLVVALESTGTYGEALRQAVTDAGLEVRRVGGKAKSDYEEIFDGVPSAHDGKDAAIIAELAALGKSQAWPYRQASQQEREMAACVDWLDAQQDIFQIWLGRLESQLACHWPELTRIVKLTSATLIQLLAQYGGPSWLAEDEDAAAELKRWGGSKLKDEKVRAICGSAQTTVGVRMTDEDRQRVRRYAEQALQARQEIGKAIRRLKQMAEEDETLQLMAQAVGPATACVLRVAVGDPSKYHCSEAYRKAMGLNLKERSSGKHKGKLKLTKWGPAIARRWLYFAAMRMVQQPEIRPWYECKKRKDGGWGSRAIIAIMRKLALAIWNVVVRRAPFERWRLFPGKPLPPPAKLAMGALPPDPRDLAHCC